MQLEASGSEKEKGPQSKGLFSFIRRKRGDEMRGRRREAILTFRFSAFPLFPFFPLFFRFFLALKPCKRRIFPLLPDLNIALSSIRHKGGHYQR